MARSADDLELLFDVIAGPVVGEDVGWRLELPAARHERLADYRVAIMPPLPWAQPSAALQSAVDELAEFVSAEGAVVATAMPDLSLDEYLADYHRLLVAMTSPPGKTLDDRRRKSDALRGSPPLGDALADGMTLDALDLIALLGRRERARAAWRVFFRDWDVLIAPNALGSAFEHRDGPQSSRTLDIDGVEVPYALNIVYAMWAVYTGQPATAFPAGTGPDGLPRGLQAIGGYLEDRTTLRFAQLLEQVWHRFEAPPGW
jgi:amidase